MAPLTKNPAHCRAGEESATAQRVTGNHSGRSRPPRSTAHGSRSRAISRGELQVDVCGHHTVPPPQAASKGKTRPLARGPPVRADRGADRTCRGYSTAAVSSCNCDTSLTCFAACTRSKVIPLQGEHVGNRWPFTTVSVRHVGMHWVVGHAETPDAGTIWPGLKTAMARLLVLRRCSI